ncbi:MAG: amidohydrolase family protein [Proteobacteria bacterium]|nr:amidohydrolase family protein [Pseudomonadota bacterium]
MIDTHAHVFHRGLTFDAARRYTPDYDAPLEAYLRQLDENGITNAVLVQPSFLGTDNDYLLDSLKNAGGRLRGIAVLDPLQGPADLAALQAAGIVGIRLNLIGRPTPDLDAPAWSRLLADVAARGWQIEVQSHARQLATLAPLLLQTGANVVLDHYALPDEALGVSDPAFDAILRLGGSPRLWVKLSAPYRNGIAGERFARGAYPLLRQALGPSQLLWGSDWPHTQFETTQDFRKNLTFLSTLAPRPGERAQIGRNAKTLFGF